MSTAKRGRPVKTEDTRPKRVPIAEQRNLISVAPKAGFERRWVNDVETRIQMFKEAGWTIVEDNLQVGDIGVTENNQSLGSGVRKYMGNNVYAILMEISEKLYKEDQKAKQDDVSFNEQAMYDEYNTGEHTYGEIKHNKRAK